MLTCTLCTLIIALQVAKGTNKTEPRYITRASKVIPMCGNKRITQFVNFCNYFLSKGVRKCPKLGRAILSVVCTTLELLMMFSPQNLVAGSHISLWCLMESATRKARKKSWMRRLTACWQKKRACNMALAITKVICGTVIVLAVLFVIMMVFAAKQR